jgi:hypothetical protein
MSKSERGKRQDWQTPVWEFSSLGLGQLRDEGGDLSITLDAYKAEQAGKFEFIWQRYCAHRTTDEGQFLPWDLDPEDSQWHHTHKVINSQWISYLSHSNDLLAILYPKLQHFVIATSDYWIEVLSEQEPVIRCCTPDKPHSEAAYRLVIPEPRLWYCRADEANFYNTLNDLPEVEKLKTYPPVDRKTQPNEIVLSLTQQYLTDDSLRTLLGLMTRYQLVMSCLASQCGPHNRKWFKDKRSFWYSSVFTQNK